MAKSRCKRGPRRRLSSSGQCSSLEADVKVFERLQIVRGLDHIGGEIGEFASLPRLYALARGFEIPLHLVDADRNAID